LSEIGLKEAEMSERSASVRIVLMRVAAVLVAGIFQAPLVGCSNQPTAPSTVASTETASSLSRFGDRTPGTIFVTSQGLYYDTFVVKDPLPMQGRFQLLVNGRTEFGPGQPGYLGGRWWEDLNGNGLQDPADHFFLCPLLPPGRPTP
jgi:hypothetical protein